jgi:cyclophilin family peptidyl-prolyl cis-trans isomerase
MLWWPIPLEVHMNAHIRDKGGTLALIALLVLGAALSGCARGKADMQAVPSSSPSPSEEPLVAGTPLPETALAGLADGLYAVVEVERAGTPVGVVVLNLEYKKAPIAVTSFVGLAEGKMGVTRKGPYFDGLSFHRVEPGFVIQGGDPQGNGTGGPGYEFPNEIDSSLSHDAAGVLAMANAGPDTNGSQFYITLAPAKDLDGGYTIFGKVVLGLDAVMKVRQGDLMKKMSIVRKGKAAGAFKADQASFDALMKTYSDKKDATAKAAAQKNEQAFLAEFAKAPKDQNGVYYKVLTQGSGPKPTKGQTVSVHYVLKLAGGDAVIDSSRERNEPLTYSAGTGSMITGFDGQVMDMKVGEKRLIGVPPAMGYGAKAVGPIPANSYLVFEVELVSIK